MTKWLAAYASTAAVMVALDLLWIGWLAKPLYTQGIGHLMAAQPNLPAAAAFYLLYPAGLLLFALAPQADAPGLLRAAGMAALFGFFAYATYDLSNLATLRDWPVGLTLLDMVWGAALSAVAATAGKAVLDRVGA